MKVKLYSDGEFIGTADHISPDTGVIIYMERYFVFNAVTTHFEQVSAQRIHAIEYAPYKAPENAPELPFARKCSNCNLNDADPNYDVCTNCLREQLITGGSL